VRIFLLCKKVAISTEVISGIGGPKFTKRVHDVKGYQFICIAIFQSMSACQLINNGWSENFEPKLVTMATYFEGWKKEDQVSNL